MNREEILSTWNIEKLKSELKSCFDNNSEKELLSILKKNSFLFYELFSRKYGIQPIFREINFGGGLRCDFAWLNDNSDGPEWVLVEIEKPAMDLFRKDNHEPTQQLNHAIEQVKSWRRYFTQNPSEKRRIFGAVGRFRFIIVGGQKEDWEKDHASKWRIDQNSEYKIEIRSSDIFSRALKILVEYPDELWSFTENPQTLKHTDLENYWKSYAYMDKWRRLMN